LGNEASSKALDVTGVYLLIGPSDANSQQQDQLYVGKGDHVDRRLRAHERNKPWWRTAVVFRRPTPLNLTDCAFLESRLYSLARDACKCDLESPVAPQIPNMSESEKRSTEELVRQAVFIATAMGWNFFQHEEEKAPVAEPPKGNGARVPIKVPVGLEPLLEDLRKAATGPSFPNAEWHWTRSYYCSKVVSDGHSLIFYRIKLAKNGFSVRLRADDGQELKFKVHNPAELDKLRGEIQVAYRSAEQYLQRGK